jgi:hypothetical protein
LILGLYFHDENWLGGYASFRRRMYRLAHIPFFGPGAVNLLFYFTAAQLSAGTAGARNSNSARNALKTVVVLSRHKAPTTTGGNPASGIMRTLVDGGFLGIGTETPEAQISESRYSEQEHRASEAFGLLSLVERSKGRFSARFARLIHRGPTIFSRSSMEFSLTQPRVALAFAAWNQQP